MRKAALNRSGGFSLIELVIVVVIIAIIGAIAIPKMSRGAAGAADSSLTQDLSILRQGLDLYQTEHGGNYPAIGSMPDALIKYSADDGTLSDTKTGNFIYGPYLRAVPPVPVGAKKGASGIDIVGNAGTATVGWIYDSSAGSIRANTTTEADTKGTLYSNY
jgi:general secretion pathway protein G